MGRKPQNLNTVATCQGCGLAHKIEDQDYQVGQLLKPYAGGGKYGMCLRCKKTMLKITKTPEPSPIKPVGWHKIPKE